MAVAGALFGLSCRFVKLTNKGGVTNEKLNEKLAYSNYWSLAGRLADGSARRLSAATSTNST